MATPKIEGVRSGKRYWIAHGFLPSEASAFKNITREAMQDSPYIQTMIETRMRRRREAIQRGWTLKEFYQWVRNRYVAMGFTKNQSDLVLRGDSQRRNNARRLAFDFFNYYKEKYGLRDESGRLIETPRRKRKVSKKPITGKRSIDQMIRKDREAIKYNQFRLKFATSDYMKNVYRTAIKNHKQRIERLKAQAKTQYD